MKVKVQPEQNGDFKPVKILVTIETEHELISLYHRFNVSPEDIKKNSCSTEVDNSEIPSRSMEIYDTLFSILKKRGLTND